MEEMSLSRVRDRSWDGAIVERRLGVGGVRDEEDSVEVGESDS
jgi:hypothetical protein